MGASASVIQEYYKAVDYWADIAGNRDWKLKIRFTEFLPSAGCHYSVCPHDRHLAQP